MEFKPTKEVREDGDTLAHELVDGLLKHPELRLVLKGYEQRNQPEPSLQERRIHLFKLLIQSPVLFLERYAHLLPLERLSFFEVFSKTNEDANWLLQRRRKEEEIISSSSTPSLSSIRSVSSRFSSSLTSPSSFPSPFLSPSPSPSLSTQFRNRRFRFLLNQHRNSDYFSDKEMQLRQPTLFHIYIGRYLTDDEYYDLQRGDLSLSQRVLRRHDLEEGGRVEANEISAKVKVKNEEDREEDEDEDEDESEEEEEEEEEEGDTNQIPRDRDRKGKGRRVAGEEREELRREFEKLMEEKWLNGEDQLYFEYKTVDEDETLDDKIEMERDAEDHYFDEEEDGIEQEGGGREEGRRRVETSNETMHRRFESLPETQALEYTGEYDY